MRLACVCMYVKLVVFKAFHIKIYVIRTAAGQTLNTDMYKLNFTPQLPAWKFIQNFFQKWLQCEETGYFKLRLKF
jgi:hypothetical protein